MPPVDPVTRQIIQSALASAADEMAVGLHRTARSTIVRDVLDFSTSICDSHGQQIAQGVTIPMHMGSVPYAMETLLKKYEGNIHPGDIFILNDPFDGGMHLPDFYVIKPVFVAGELEGFVATLAHQCDVGGIAPGSTAVYATEIYQEGLFARLSSKVPHRAISGVSEVALDQGTIFRTDCGTAYYDIYSNLSDVVLGRSSELACSVEEALKTQCVVEAMFKSNETGGVAVNPENMM